MAESRVEALTCTDPDFPLLHHTDLIPPQETDPVALQAIKSFRCEAEPLSSSSIGDIDPKSSLCFPLLSFEQNMPLLSSQQSSREAESGLPASLLSADLVPDGLILSSCSEDAEGELEESFYSEHSFWMAQPADTSTSTVATLDVDDPQIPLLGRDGTWKATEQQNAATRGDDVQEGEHRRTTSQRGLSLNQLGKVSKPNLLYNSATTSTLQKRAPSLPSSDSEDVPLSWAANKKQKKSTANKTRDDSGTSKNVTKAKKASKKQPKASKPKKKATTRRPLSSSSKREDAIVSSEIGSISASINPSSPASSTGRYRLRKKESVPELNLSLLMTPPRNIASLVSDEAVDGWTDWVDQPEEDRGRIFTPSPTAMPGAPTTKLEDSYDADSAGEGDELGIPSASPDSARVRVRGQRTFPAHFEIHADFPLLYQRYCVPSSVSPEVLEMLLRGLNHADVDDEFQEVVDRAQTVQGTFNKPRSILDLYTPRFVKGVGAQKVGMCPVCYEDGKVKFFKTKLSAYNYHLQNFHGISALTGLPFTPPSKFRTESRPNAKPKERRQIIQGLCHSCNKYIDIQGPKETEVKVAEIYWWKHAQACHRSGNKVPDGVGGYFVENKWYERGCAVLGLLGGFEGELRRLLSGSK
ncbi:hypothetical protein NDA18_005037 [Ustilago nuda]|nr:hypothetical protein NDA18_005037 [Ustilago nuda]